MSTPVTEALNAYRARLRPGQLPRREGSRRRWKLAGTLAAGLLVAGGATWAWGQGPMSASDRQTAPGSQVTAPPADSAAPLPQPEPGSASSPAGPLAAAMVVGPMASWRSWSGALSTWLPAATEIGPADSNPDRLAGFAHTQAGALMAAANVYPAIYYTRDRAAWDSLANQRVVWADGARDTLADSLDRVWTVRDRDAVLRPVGFRMLSYTGELSRIRMWWRLERLDSEPVTVGAIVTVRWVEGDWWLVFEEPAMDLRALDPARDGYVPWGPGDAA